MYVTPTILDPAVVDECKAALAALSQLKKAQARKAFPSLKAHLGAIKRAVRRIETTWTPFELDAAVSGMPDPRADALEYADDFAHYNPTGADRMRRWAAA